MLHPTGTLSPQDILAEVRKFISGAVRPTHSTSTLDVTRTALSLLRNVPAVRDAVLEYFCNVFFVAVTKYVRQIEVSKYLIIYHKIYDLIKNSNINFFIFLDKSKFSNM